MSRAQSFGDLLFEYRKRFPLTQKQLAKALEVDFTYISKIEGGKAPPPARDKIELAAKFLKLSASEREELFRSAEKIPSDVTKLFTQEPAAFRLFRTIRQAPVHEQGELLERLIKEVETARGKAKTK